MIRQRTEHDCVVACLAMFYNTSYDSVVMYATHKEVHEEGMYDSRILEIAQRIGHSLEKVQRESLNRSLGAILVVPSLNLGLGATHVVFWDGQKIHDPKKGQGKYYSNSEVAWKNCVAGFQFSKGDKNA